MKVGINGFGRIGKIVTRILLTQKKHQITHINDPGINIDLAIHLLTYDSVHGKFNKKIQKIDEKLLLIDGNEITFTFEKNIDKIDWKQTGTDIVIESSGQFTSKKDAEKHISSGAKKVIITAPSPDIDMIVPGVNADIYTDQKIISVSSCTTNCLSHLALFLDQKYGIQKALMSTVHAITATQKIVDGSSQKDIRLGRSGLLNIIPSTTGAALAVGKIIPKLSGKITGMAFRVPVSNVSVVDLTCHLDKKPESEQEINDYFEEIAKTSKYVDYVQNGAVSSDFTSSEKSCIIDASSTILIDNMVKVVAFYDNEYGYSSRVVDTIDVISS